VSASAWSAQITPFGATWTVSRRTETAAHSGGSSAFALSGKLLNVALSLGADARPSSGWVWWRVAVGSSSDIAWGIFNVPEQQVGVLSDVGGLDVVELGRGTHTSPPGWPGAAHG